MQFAIGGTATATSIQYHIQATDNATNAIVISSQQTALGGAAGQAGSTGAYVVIDGEIVVNAAGTLTVQFAQNASNGTSTVAAGSTFSVWPIS
jgi:glycerol-3-phosphate dehydrogenase